MPIRIRAAAPLPRLVTLCAASALLALTAGIAPTAADAQSVPSQGQANVQSRRQARVAGRVLSQANGNPLAYATVELTDLRRSTLTDENGNFVFDRVPAGEHPLSVRMVGYQAHSRPVSADDAAAVEVRLADDPVLLAGITVTTNRFEQRIRTVPYAVRVQGKRDVYATAASDAEEFVRARSGLMRVECADRTRKDCFLIRGRVGRPVVYIDDAPAPGGVEMLAMIPRQEISRVEFIRSGSIIRVYTERFMEWAARHNYRPTPLSSY